MFQSTVWLLLIFFVFALIAYVIVHALEGRTVKAAGNTVDSGEPVARRT